MRLLIDETFATATYTVPITSGWVSPPEGITVEIANHLTTDSASEEHILLAPASEILRLQQTHAGGRRRRGDRRWQWRDRHAHSRPPGRGRGDTGAAARNEWRRRAPGASDAETLLRHRTHQLGARRRVHRRRPAPRSSSSRGPRRCASQRRLQRGSEPGLVHPDRAAGRQPCPPRAHALPPKTLTNVLDLPRRRENRGLGTEAGVAAAARRPGRGWQRSCERLLGSAAAETGAGGSPGAARSTRQRFAGNVRPAPGERKVSLTEPALSSWSKPVPS